MADTLNRLAVAIAEETTSLAGMLRLRAIDVSGGGRVVDCGVEVEGGIGAGIALARICMAGLSTVTLIPGEVDGSGWPHVQVVCDNPVESCLLSQYAGWQISVEKYFAMGSGPMRAAAASEELYDRLHYREDPDSTVGVLETGQLPDAAVLEYIAEKTGVEREHIILFAAPTASPAGNIQVVARSIETALHKLFELGFDVHRIRSGFGTAPLPPVAADDLTGIGRTNDAILYGGRVTLWVTGDDDSLTEIGPQVPSVASECYGKPFLNVFEDAGRDFYKIDPHLFSPAEIVFQNLDTGNVHRFGNTNSEILYASFGV